MKRLLTRIRNCVARRYHRMWERYHWHCMIAESYGNWSGQIVDYHWKMMAHHIERGWQYPKEIRK